MKSEDRELGRQRAKPSNIKAGYSLPTCARTTVHHYNRVLFNISLPPDQHYISDVSKWR